MSRYRYMPAWPLPTYVFVPGANPHPKKSGGHMEGQGDPVAPAIDAKRPETSDHLRFALDLFNHGYYWESHVYFEALWNAHGRTGAVADLLKAFIKLGAAGVKVSIGQAVTAEAHVERARELIRSVRSACGDSLLGFDLAALEQELRLPLGALTPQWR